MCIKLSHNICQIRVNQIEIRCVSFSEVSSVWKRTTYLHWNILYYSKQWVMRDVSGLKSEIYLHILRHLIWIFFQFTGIKRFIRVNHYWELVDLHTEKNISVDLHKHTKNIFRQSSKEHGSTQYWDCVITKNSYLIRYIFNTVPIPYA